MGALYYPLYILGDIKGDTRSLDYSSPGGTPPAFDCERQELGLGANYHMGGCQNYGPILGTLNIRCRIIMEIQKKTIILTTTHMDHIIRGL